MSKDPRKGLSAGRGIRVIRNRKTGRVGYRVQVMVNGRRAQRMCETYEQAAALRTEWLTGGVPEPPKPTGGAPVPPPPAEPADDELATAPPSQESDDASTHTVEDAVRWYQGDLKLRDRSALGVYQIEKWLTWNGTHDPIVQRLLATPLAHLDATAILEYLHDRETVSRTKSGERFKRTSILREYRMLHTAIKHFRKDLEWPNMRGKRGWVEGSSLPREPLTAEQKKRLLLALEEPYRTAAQLAMLLNPRRGSFAKMEQRHCRLDQAQPVLILPETKTAAMEVVALSQPAVDLLRAQIARHPGSRWVFPSRYKQGAMAISGGQFYVKVKRAARAIGRPDFVFHGFRHQFASDLLERGYSIDQIAKAGRWGRAVKLYAHQSDDVMRAMQLDLVGAHAGRPGRRGRSGRA
jgi:integrase